MLPNRINEVVRAILSAGVAAAVATAITAGSISTTTFTATNSTSTTLSVGSLQVDSTNGSRKDGEYRATLTVNADSIAANGSTTTVVTLTGASSGDHCSVGSTSGDLQGSTSTVLLTCRVTGSNAATVYYYNTSSTAAFDAGSSVLSVVGYSF